MPKELTHWYLAKRLAEKILEFEGPPVSSAECTIPGCISNKGAKSYISKNDLLASSPARGGSDSLSPTIAVPSPGPGTFVPGMPATGGRPAFPTLARCLRSAPNAYLLGAVGPDYLFYYLWGKELETFRTAAMVLHGSDGGNTLRPIQAAVEVCGGRMKEAEMAFLSGYMAHVVGDAVFHPLVLYTVGKGPGRPQYEHHVFESVLDLYILDRWGKEGGALPTLPTTLKELTHRMTSSGELTRKGFLRMLGSVSFLGEPYSAESLQTCLKRYERIQGWFWTSLGCVGARLLKALNRKYAFFEASFYQKRFYRYREAFRGVLEYRHPVTGASRTVAIEDLVMEMVEEGLSHAVRLEPLFNQILGAGKAESWFETPTEMFRFNGRSGESAPASGGEAQSAVADVPGLPHPGGSGVPGEIPPGIEILPAVLEGLRALQGPNLETGLFADRADRILYTRAEGLVGLFGPYGYRRG